MASPPVFTGPFLRVTLANFFFFLNFASFFLLPLHVKALGALRTTQRCMSENTLNAALRRLGYAKDQQTAHGFRTIASTLLNELGFPPDLIELQLAHKPRDKVRAAYNRAERLADRRAMMQAWADYLEGLKTGAKVTAIRRSR